ncbi:cbb3-type cytochrome c oxidase subunit 3 [Novosphingobium lentum]|uniref:cbb3-type cytochrome c oxidase subunit 3 n=1 Tax=Novosphingobium lentum TaxID=145287 RepID=UPI0008355628|nr:cbb3-type cytochrome c oxidase subunit 3 [Novosphingobium lentum]
MTATQTYDALRHLADSWGLVAMGVFFTLFVAWPFRPGASNRNQAAATSIFEDDDDD